MITEFVLFDVPRDMTREKLMEGIRSVTGKWRKHPELVRKTFVFDKEASQAGAYYLWKNKEAALAAHDQAWRDNLMRLYGSVPTIRFFDTPAIVDNALGEVIES
ncbi:MAG TPA: hypothetical protein VNS02_08755 [Rhizobiaceae bacterium]|nr:hypothetical protein [Rhizobiaceae bacterium]